MFSIHKNATSIMFLGFSNFKIVDLIEIAILIIFQLHLVGEVKVLIQNFLFYHVLGEGKVLIQNLFVSSCTR